MAIIEDLAAKAAKKCPTILFPEAEDEKIVEVAMRLAKEGVCKPVLMADVGKEPAPGIDEGLVKVVRPEDYEGKIDDYAAGLEEPFDMPARMIAKRMRKKILWVAGAMVRNGEVDGMVAGLNHSTSDVIFAGNMIVGLAEGVRIPSSYFLMDIPGFAGGEDGKLIYSDCGVTVQPSSEELASIAETTADTAKNVFGWEPRVAMLSYSTKGSGKSPDSKKVVEAYELVKQERPDLKVDGELQADAALVPAVAAKKAGEDNLLQGKANVLIFPDLDAGNIAYKLTERLTGGKAYGPMLQGFAKPITDLSRGSSADDIYGVAVIVAAQI
jgi:phosphate acetyltransferase